MKKILPYLLSALAVVFSVTFGWYQMQKASSLEKQLAEQTKLTKDAYESMSDLLNKMEQQKATIAALTYKEAGGDK